MDHPTKLDALIKTCEKVSLTLENLNPNDELLRFDGTGLSEREKDLLLDMLLYEFGPPDYKSDCPTDDELIYTFQSLLNALEAAVEKCIEDECAAAIKKAQNGFYGQH